MEGMALVPIFCISLRLLVLQPCLHVLRKPPLSFLPCGISVGEKVLIAGFDCGMHRVHGQTSM